jgi:hypothetical protein
MTDKFERLQKWGADADDRDPRDGISGDLIEAIGDLSDAVARAYDAIGKRTRSGLSPLRSTSPPRCSARI